MLARYLAGSNKRNTNLDNIEKCIDKAASQGVTLDVIEQKVLKYIYVLTKIGKIAITASNIARWNKMLTIIVLSSILKMVYSRTK